MSAALFEFAVPGLNGQTPDAVRYTIRFPAPVTHYLEVDAVYPAKPGSPLDLFLPVWTPGSYLVREYARNLEDVRAFTSAGAPLAIEKTRKNRWRVALSDSTSVRVHYKVYCREMTVRTNWVDENFALIVGAATFLTPVDSGKRKQQVEIELPAGWKLSISGMPETALQSLRSARLRYARRFADPCRQSDGPRIRPSPERSISW